MSLIRIYVHAVWAVKFRDGLLEDVWRDELHAFLGGCFRDRGNTAIEINSVSDHLHALFRYSARENMGNIMQHVKGESSRWINQRFMQESGRFRWQGGYGAFSISHNNLQASIEYIQRQQIIHHQRAKMFLEEYDEMVAHHGDGSPKEHFFDALI